MHLYVSDWMSKRIQVLWRNRRKVVAQNITVFGIQRMREYRAFRVAFYQLFTTSRCPCFPTAMAVTMKSLDGLFRHVMLVISLLILNNEKRKWLLVDENFVILNSVQHRANLGNCDCLLQFEIRQQARKIKFSKLGKVYHWSVENLLIRYYIFWYLTVTKNSHCETKWEQLDTLRYFQTTKNLKILIKTRITSSQSPKPPSNYFFLNKKIET